MKHCIRLESVFPEVLLYHVVPHTVYSAGLFNKERLRTLDSNGDPIQVTITGEQTVKVYESSSILHSYGCIVISPYRVCGVFRPEPNDTGFMHREKNQNIKSN